MANPEHIAILKQGVDVWNHWREENPKVEPDLSHADLYQRDLEGAELSRAKLVEARLNEVKLGGARLERAILRKAGLYMADLSHTYLFEANLNFADLRYSKLIRANLKGADLAETLLQGVDLREADLRAANLDGADLGSANLSEANLRRAKLRRSNLGSANLIGVDLRWAQLARVDLSEADLTGANLTGANLTRATLVETNLQEAVLTDCSVYGVSAWRLKLPSPEKQRNLRITPNGEPEVTVDNLEVAQFVYLLLHNEKIRGVIDTIGRKGVLILGRFHHKRKAVLDAIKDRLRELDLVPMVFDWDKPTKRDLTETVQLLANMSRFVVADVTDAKSIPQELSHIVPFLPSVPVRPIILAGDPGYSMFEHWKGYNTMLPVFEYDDRDHLIENIEEALLDPVAEWEAGHDRTKALEDEIATLKAELAAREADG